MEHLLNLLWLLVAGALFALVMRERASGRLRCSLLVALGCTALIVLALFPALSMTDDLARAKLFAETSGGHADCMMLLRSMEDIGHNTTLVLPLLLLLLLMAIRLAGANLLSRRREELPSLRLRGVRPRGMRPPPVAAFSL